MKGSSGPEGALVPFPLTAVRLLERPFLANMRRTRAYLLFVDIVDPAVEGDMTSASASPRTPCGIARTAWTRHADRFRLTVDVPAGSTAEVHLPASDGRAEAPAGAQLLRTGGTETVYEVGSGHWGFHSTLPLA
ncbi:alpha-L-rhamnosidase C-terminal domain-containing protein [Streptomyces sp. NPDC054834]